jgi:ABC-2 type transport system permease protein
MSLVLAYARASVQQLLRIPAYSVPTLLFPSFFFLLFGARAADRDPVWLTAGFAATAVLGVAFFQFGVGLAIERSSPWERYARTLPVGASTRLAAQVLSAVVFAALSAGAVVAVAGAVTGSPLSPLGYAALAVALLAGAVPFALLGIALGYLVSPRAAVPVANVVFLPLAVAGSLWTPPDELPGSADRLSSFVPTRTWGDVIASAADRHLPSLQHVATLAGWTALFAVAAVIAYRRDEGERFR